MSIFNGIEPMSVFKYFEEICALPRGSGNTAKIADYCVSFAKQYGLSYYRDDADNVVIYKPASKGFSDAEPVILQGHIDMVCQKEEDCEIDFMTDGVTPYIDGDFIKAKGTTLGADNGIAVAMIFSILADDTLAHPAIEAVLTADEETGMIGALHLDCSVLKSKRMINLDAESDDCVTVSCAGGSDFMVNVDIRRTFVTGTEITVSIGGLKGGHSGVCINCGRENADILAGKFLQHMRGKTVYNLISIDGGDKGNAIPNSCVIKVCTKNKEEFITEANSYFALLKEKLSLNEENFTADISVGQTGEFAVLTDVVAENAVSLLFNVPNGVIDMSDDIEGLVETSLNLGILKTEKESVFFLFSLRSNKSSSLTDLEMRFELFTDMFSCRKKFEGRYSCWERKKDSPLRDTYIKCYSDKFGTAPTVEAIHAGLECGTFAGKIEGLDCISVGPCMEDVHTVNERLCISSVQKMYSLICDVLSKLG